MPEERNDEVLLRVEHLCQYFRSGKYENKAVDDVSFDIKKGEVFGLVGESGCGKTTTGRSIIKIYDITSGSVYFKGQRVTAGTRSYRNAIKEAKQRIGDEIKALKANSADDAQIAAKKAELAEIIAKNKAEIASAKHDSKYSDRDYAATLVAQVKEEYEEKMKNASPEELPALTKKFRHDLNVAKKTKLITKIQMIFQDPVASLNPRMTVKELIAEGLVINGIKDKQYIEEKVYEILELVGLVREHAGRYPHEFSGGQKQRIGIARSVIMRPDMIIADEPISALDVSIRAQVLNLLSRLQKERGLTYLFIAHDLSVMRFICDRIAVIHKGVIVELAETEKLYRHPLHPYTRALLSAIPLPDPESEKKKVLEVYDPSKHNYETDKPVWTEIEPGHFVMGNQEELAVYRQKLAQ